jgi:probable HAF family extracellular repeat protein
MSRMLRATGALRARSNRWGVDRGESVCRVVVALCLAFAARAAHAQALFMGLGDLPGGSLSSIAYGVSADGSVVVGSGQSASGMEAFRWTEAGGMVGLGDLPGDGFYSDARAVSADGSVVVGRASSEEAGAEAFRWTAAGGMQGLGTLGAVSRPPVFFAPASYANGVSGDGSVVVGRSTSDVAEVAEVFRWTTAGGLEGLGDLPDDGYYSEADGVSADGSTIVGFGSSRLGTQAFRWTAAEGMVGLGDLPGDTFFYSHARAVSANGSVVVGASQGANGYEAFRWTLRDGMVGLGDIPGGSFGSDAYAVSAGGWIVVGEGRSASGQEASIWDPQHGMRSVHDLLMAAGADVEGWRLRSAYGISADGRTIVGRGINPSGQTEAWLAVLPPPPPPACSDEVDNDGDGQIDLDDPGCPFPEAPLEDPACDDGLDNDRDGLVDFDDPICQPNWPYWEDAHCGLGVELVALVPLATWLRRRRGRAPA